MKSFLYTLCVIVTTMVFSGCPAESDNNGNNGGGAITTLQITNNTSLPMRNIMWNGATFVNDIDLASPGWTRKMDVEAGTIYITFEIQFTPGGLYNNVPPVTASVRTGDIVTVEEGETKNYIILNSTLVVEGAVTKTIVDYLQATAVWFDDAEREMPPDYETEDFAGYYSIYSLPGLNADGLDGGGPGYKVIAVGGTNTAELRLRVNLPKNGKIMFWLANKANGTRGAAFSINGEVKRTWANAYYWSHVEFDLQAGQNDLVWEKKDGGSTGNDYYLYLDDILVYYTN